MSATKTHIPSFDPTDSDDKLIRAINRIYHELTADAFNDDHRYRHRIEKIFWNKVGRVALNNSRKMNGRIIVDLACGTGFVGQCLQQFLNDKDYLLAMDLGRTSLQHTRHNLQSTRSSARTSLSCLAGDGQKLPLANESVDLLTINAGLHHLPKPAQALSEIDRVLQPGGWFAMGYEPNQRHFASPAMTGLARRLETLWWYASLRQNKRRIAKFLQSKKPASTTNAISDQALVTAMNEKLLARNVIQQPMKLDQLLDLVDPHARGAHDHAGFVPEQLLRGAFPDYEIHLLEYTDYLGQAARYFPSGRNLLDTMFRLLKPAHGSLFCWLVRKPVIRTKTGTK